MKQTFTMEKADEPKTETKENNTKFSDVAAIGASFNKFKASRQVRKRTRFSNFERRYSKLAINQGLVPERKRIDYVLVYPSQKHEDAKDPAKKAELKRHERNRTRFTQLLKNEGFSMQFDTIGDFVYIKLHCPFKRICVEAERVHIEMPLRDCEVPETVIRNPIMRFLDEKLDAENDVNDFVSAQFIMDKIHLFEGYEDPTKFFRPAIRSLLVHHILINLDIRTAQEIEEDDASENENEDPSCMCLPAACRSHTPQLPTVGGVGTQQALKRKGLKYLLMKKSFVDSFILHEDSSKSREKEDTGKDYYLGTDTPIVPIEEDPRRELDDRWSKVLKFQPLWSVRNYFGEKIAFYFAWTGMLIATLWIPMLFGLAIFLFGLYESVTDNASYSNSTSISQTLKDVLGDVKKAFDNDVTPFFALFICAWGTVFLEMWKRQCSTLAYEWDVDQFEANEPDRPQFYGTSVKPDPVTNEDVWFYPLRRQLMKLLTSCSIIVFMCIMVVASLVAVIAYRVIMNVDYCPNMPDNECFLVTTLASSILNAVSILIFGKIYDKMAVVLTDWENHRTQTKYDDALIIKLFAFQFVNSYASCFYIAFFRGRTSTFSDRYSDSCEGSCMTQLSFQVMVLMVAKPFPKLMKDIVVPFLKKMWTKRPACCCRCQGKNQVTTVDSESPQEGGTPQHSDHKSFLERERAKPDLGDFTLAEYTEKVILYGFLMLFACSFPLAPLLALVICYIDIKVDAKRMLWWYRRPVAFIAEDIGMWFDILQLVNFIGVLTNAFIIAFTSNWGNQFDSYGKLWVVIGFEHAVFALKFILAYMIPDVPQNVTLAIRREKYLILKKFDEGSKQPVEEDYSSLFPPGGRSGDGSSVPKDMIAEDDEDDDIDVKPSATGQRSTGPTDTSMVKRKWKIETRTEKAAKGVLYMTCVDVNDNSTVYERNEDENLNQSMKKQTSESSFVEDNNEPEIDKKEE